MKKLLCRSWLPHGPTFAEQAGAASRIGGARTPLLDDNVTAGPDVFCSGIAASPTVTEMGRGFFFQRRKRRVEVSERDMTEAE